MDPKPASPSPSRPARIGSLGVGGGSPFLLIAGPCVIEPGDLTYRIAEELRILGEELGIGVVFKASYDKANRTSRASFRGVGMDAGLKVLAKVKASTGLPVTSDIHETVQAAAVAEVVDLLQVPAFLARQTDLLEAAAATGRAVNVKKGQFMAPWDMKHVVTKLTEAGCSNILLTERGTTFGYGRLINDFRALPIMAETGAAVVFDATHSVQLPSAGANNASAGERAMVPHLARAAVAVGCDALFLEVHPDPDSALSDGPNALRLEDLRPLLQTCLRIRAAAFTA